MSIVTAPGRLETFIDRILVRTGKGGIHQAAGIGVADVDRDPGVLLAYRDDPVEVVEIKARINALAEHVQGQVENIDVAGPFAVAEQGALHPPGSGQHGQFGGCHRSAAVIVGVDADCRPFPVGQVADEPFDLVGIDIGAGHLHRGRQVDGRRPVGCGLPGIEYCLTDLKGKIQLGAGEALGRVFIADVRVRMLSGRLADQGRALDRQVDYLGPVHLKDHPPPQGGGGVIEMDNGPAGAADGGEGPLDQGGAGLGQRLDGDVVRKSGS